MIKFYKKINFYFLNKLCNLIYVENDQKHFIPHLSNTEKKFVHGIVKFLIVLLRSLLLSKVNTMPCINLSEYRITLFHSKTKYVVLVVVNFI